MQIGLDVGSTTVKAVVLNAEKEIVFSRYQRHFSQIVEKTHALLTEISALLPEGEPVSLAISGSAGMGLADANFGKLREAMAAGDAKAAFEAAHALKGAIGNLSLTPLYNPISELTERLRLCLFCRSLVRGICQKARQ